jgi:hypothetical protein
VINGLALSIPAREIASSRTNIGLALTMMALGDQLRCAKFAPLTSPPRSLLACGSFPGWNQQSLFGCHLRACYCGTGSKPNSSTWYIEYRVAFPATTSFLSNSSAPWCPHFASPTPSRILSSPLNHSKPLIRALRPPCLRPQGPPAAALASYSQTSTPERESASPFSLARVMPSLLFKSLQLLANPDPT